MKMKEQERERHVDEIMMSGALPRHVEKASLRSASTKSKGWIWKGKFWERRGVE
jgi:hypothetical protein